MARVTSKRFKRSGTTIAEMAAVVIVFLMLLYGIMEYCRLIYFRQVIFNAAREGARQAVVSTSASTIVSDTQAQVKKYLSGLDTKISNYSCDVYLADATGTKIGNAGDAAFAQYIAVDVQGDYKPILPTFLFMGKTIHLRSQTMMYSEAN
jgi:Flp pilus assembly protein TadG